jgi:phosphoglycerate dehydrogenase-like enzyme
MMHSLLILTRRTDEYRRLIEAACLPDLTLAATDDPAVARDQAASYDVAFGEPSLLRQVILEMTSLRWAQSTWAGVEPLLDPALRRDYVLTNARGVFGRLMAEYVFTYLLAHERRILEKYASQQQRRWDTTRPGTLLDKRIGLLGVGSIGAVLARTAKHFGMIVHGYTRVSEECSDVDAYFHGDGLVAFASGLDYLVSVMPATAATRGGRDRTDVGIARRPPRRRRPRRLPDRAAAARASPVDHAERADYVAHGCAQRAGRYRRGVRRQLSPLGPGKTAAACR